MPFSKVILSTFVWGLGGVFGVLAFNYFDHPTLHASLAQYEMQHIIGSNPAEFMRRAQLVFFAIVAGYSTYIPK